jgi:NAD(P)-dependent dehydrogenase (short-subunit alcohol dehydrogenase family)
LKDKLVVITGGTGGIGKQTAVTLAKMGARIIVTGRSQPSGEAAIAEIKQASGNSQIELLLADVSKQTHIHALVKQFKTKYERLDVLINNAGLAASTRQLTEDGIESNFAVNVVAPFLLTHLLMDSLKASPSARVINLMGGDVPAKLELDNLQAEHSFDGLKSYSQSKLAMMVVMYEFAQRIQGAKITMNTCYPGQASTNMTRSVTPEMFPGMMRWIFPLFKWVTRPDGGKSAAKASQSSVYLASSVEVEGVTGKYYNPKCQATSFSPVALDSETRQRLWEIVERLANINS